MGRTISERTALLLDKRQREGRLCQMGPTHVARAVWRVKELVWDYPQDRNNKDGKETEGIYCNRCFTRYVQPWLSKDMSGSNMRFLSAERF